MEILNSQKKRGILNEIIRLSANALSTNQGLLLFSSLMLFLILTSMTALITTPIYSCVGISVLVVSYAVYRYQFNMLLVFFVFFYFYAAYLIPDKEGEFHTYDGLLPICFLMYLRSLFYYFTKKNSDTNKNHAKQFNTLYYFLGLLILASVFMAFFSEGQSILSGIISIRRYFLLGLFWILPFYPFEKSKFYFWLVAVGWALLALNWIQYFFVNDFNLFYFPVDRFRVGQYRNFGGYPIIIFVMFIYFEKMVVDKKIFDFLKLIFIFFSSFYLSQNRVSSFAIALSFIFIWLFKIKKNKNQIIMSFLAVVGILIFSVLLSTELNSNFLVKILTHTYDEINTTSGTFQIRIDCINFYWEQIKASLIIGNGNLSSNYLDGSLALGRSLGFDITDIGWFGVIYNYGFFGVVWIIFYLKKIYRLSSLDKNYTLLAYSLFCAFSALTIDFVLNQSFFIFTIFAPHLLNKNPENKAQKTTSALGFK